MTGAQAILEFLRIKAIDRIFGNPGTTEMPLMKALVNYPDITYHLVLHEGIAIAMADAYAQAMRTPSVVLLHATGGVANALGLLYNASKAETPMLVIAGQQSRALHFSEGFLYSNMTSMLSPIVKSVQQVSTSDDLLSILRRAWASAIASPTGPVAVIVPMDILNDELHSIWFDKVPDNGTHAPSIPSEATLERIVQCTQEARHPILLVGDRVGHEPGGVEQLVQLANKVGWPVWLEAYPTRALYPVNGPLFAGILPRTAQEIAQRFCNVDLIVNIGARMFEIFIDDGHSALSPGTPIIDLQPDRSLVSRNFPVLAGYGGPLVPLLKHLTSRMAHGHQKIPLVQTSYPDLWEPLGNILPSSVIVIEEAISWRLPLLYQVPRPLPDTLYGQKGGTIGWGVGAAIGAAMGHPGQPVLAIIGDGSFLMAWQGLFNAAHSGLPITYVVVDNGGYDILRTMASPLKSSTIPGLDVTGINYAAICQTFDIPYIQTSKENLAQSVMTRIARRKLSLIHVIVPPTES